MSLQTRLADLITAIGADIKALQAAGGGTPNQYGASTSNQVISGNSDTIVLGSTVAIPQGTVKSETIYRCKFNVVKTAAATAAPTINIRVGTNGSTLDTSRASFSFAAQTGVIDEGVVEVDCVFRSANASAQIQALGRLTHRLATTGLSTSQSSTVINLGGVFDVTGANLKISVTLNAGPSSNWTLSLVSAELLNLT